MYLSMDVHTRAQEQTKRQEGYVGEGSGAAGATVTRQLTRADLREHSSRAAAARVAVASAGGSTGGGAGDHSVRGDGTGGSGSGGWGWRGWAPLHAGDVRSSGLLQAKAVESPSRRPLLSVRMCLTHMYIRCSVWFSNTCT